MKYHVYKLNFKAPLHIGEEGIGAEKIETYIHSDTLTGAIANMYPLLGMDFSFENPPFLLSSAFPFADSRYFFPVPIGSLHSLMAEVEDLSKVKKLKKVKFIEKSLLEKLLNGEHFSLSDVDWDLLEKFPKYLLPPSKNKEFSGIYSISELPRIGVSRLNNSATEGKIFYFSQMNFKENAGLFFLAQIQDEEIRKFETALSLLADEGLGADRNVGKGHFVWDKDEFDISIPNDADAIYLVSLYYPNRDEIGDLINIDSSYYKIVSRKGFVFNSNLSGLRRAPVRMFEEGSIFALQNSGKPTGGNPIVIQKGQLSELNIYRYGKAMYFPIKRRIFNE
ncbi:MAG: type III-A CRISPR-associated RAMP protein Csm4 [Calditrichia bacterium]